MKEISFDNSTDKEEIKKYIADSLKKSRYLLMAIYHPKNNPDFMDEQVANISAQMKSKGLWFTEGKYTPAALSNQPIHRLYHT